MNKRGTVDFLQKWAEISFLTLFLVGFFISVLAESALMAYIFIIICGLVSGRYLHQKRSKYPIPFFYIVISFLLGFILGEMITKNGLWKVSVLLYIAANMLSYFLYKKEILLD